MDNYQITSYSGAEIEALLDKIDDLGAASQSTAGLMSAADKAKLDVIGSGAQANVLEGVKLSGADLPITEKKVNIPADSSPTSGSNSLVRSGGVFNAIKDFITRSVNDLVNYYTKSETYTKTEVNNIIGSLQQFHYEIYASTSAVTNPQSNVLYLIGPTGTGSDKYEEYVYSNGWVKIGDTTIDLSGYATTEQMNAAINNALNDYATKEEVSQLGQQVIYDVTMNNAGSPTFASLSALLSDANIDTLIPTAVRAGGMSIRFVQTSDNKYVQYRLMTQSFTTDTTQWAICGNSVYVENSEFVYVFNDAGNKIIVGVKKNGDIYYGYGVPSQIVDYITEQINVIKNGTNSTAIDGINKIIAFLSDFSTSNTLKSLLDNKVDKESGKSLIQTDVAERTEFVDNQEWIDVKTDSEGKILEGIRNGKREFNLPVEFNGEVHFNANESDQSIAQNYLISCKNLRVSHVRGYNEAHVKFDKITIKKGSEVLLEKTFDQVKYDSSTNPTGLYLSTPRTNYAGKKFFFAGNNGNYFQTIVYDTAQNKITQVAIVQDTHIVLFGLTVKYENTTNFEAQCYCYGILSDLWNSAISEIYEPAIYYKKNIFIQNQVRRKLATILPLSTGLFKFIFFTDSHSTADTTAWANTSALFMNYIGKNMAIDAIVNGGDILTGGTDDKVTGIECIINALENIDNKDNLLSIIGNHDYNSIADNEHREHQLADYTIFPSELYELIGKTIKDDSIVWGSKPYMYYYKDYSEYKIRAIFLNTNDWSFETEEIGGVEYLKRDPMSHGAIRQEQMNWFANTALNLTDKQTPSDWHVILFTHIPLHSEGAGIIENQSAIDTILNGFMTGTDVHAVYTDTTFDGDISIDIETTHFANQGQMNFIGNIAGHLHYDWIHQVQLANSSYTVIVTDQAFADSAEREAFTINEIAIDFGIVDKTNRKVYLKRFGYGADREFSY